MRTIWTVRLSSLPRLEGLVDDGLGGRIEIGGASLIALAMTAGADVLVDAVGRQHEDVAGSRARSVR